MKKNKWKKRLSCLLSLSLLLALLTAVEVHAGETPSDPVPAPTQLTNGIKGTAYNETLTTAGTVTWSLKSETTPADKKDTDPLSGLPDEITLDPAGKLTGTPTRTGTWQFTLIADNKTDKPVETSYLLSIMEPEKETPVPIPTKAPEITTATVKDGIVGTAYTQTLEASGSPELIWRHIEGTLPDGITLEPAGKLTGTPTKDGTFNFTLEVSNAKGSDTKDFTITIAPAKPAAEAPVITTGSLPDGTVEKAYEADLTATGTEPITWSVKEGAPALPDGITLTGSKLTGTPTKAGTFNFTLAAENEAGSDAKALSIRIAEKPAAPIKPVITTETLPGGMTDTAYSADLKAEGTEPITWKVKDKTSLPEGIALTDSEQKDARLTGTPKKAGTYEFTLVVTNAAGSTEKAFRITIVDKPVKPTITTANLPDGITGTAYHAELKADGTAPITWKVKDGTALPDGITLKDNKLSGTPTKAGTFKFTLTAANSAGTTDKEYTVTIKEPEKKPEKKYDVTVTNDGNGTASADITSAAEGTKITLTAKPKDGYHFKEWKLLKGTVTIKDNTFTMPKENVTLKAMFEKDTFVYKVTKGSGGIHRIGDGKALTFTCNGDLKDLTGIYVDKSLVNSSYYTVASGSTVLTLKADYLDKLKVGTHKLTFKYGDNSAETTFKITAKAAAKTGDNTSVQIWLFAMGIALLAAAAIIIRKRRHNV